MEITVDGLRTQYIDCGTGPVALLLHGWGVDAATYHLITDHLVSLGYRVVAPDLPGFGGSEEPKTPWTVSDYAAFVDHFTAALGLERVTLLGHSYGCRIGIKLLAGEGTFAVDRVVFFGAAGVKPRRSLWFYCRQTGYKIGKWALSLPPVKRRFPDALENLRNKRASADYKKASPVMRQTLVRSISEDLTPLLPKITAPTLLIFGDTDTATPLYMGKIMEKAIPDAGLVTLHGGHYAFAEQWGTCARVLTSFLGKGGSPC